MKQMRLQTRLTQNRMRPKQMIQHRKTMKQHRKQIAATQAGNAAQPVVDGADVTVAGTSITIPAIKFQGANAAVAEALTKDVKIDAELIRNHSS